MAASTSTSSSATVYDVFISHRGPDVKKTLASHLYYRLRDHGLQVFLDYQEIEEGETILSEIEGAIASASVHVAIFSPEYAESTWCLAELQLMWESKSPVIPVFYKVKPTDLRWTEGKEKENKYAGALRNHEKKRTLNSQPRHNSTTIENWRKALHQVSLISGFELEALNGDEGKLVDEVVECVLKRVKRPELDVAKYPTGLEEKAQDFERKVLSQEKSTRVQVVGIAGLGGVGKTTLAKKLFNQKSSNYSQHCFLFDVKENATSLHCLQQNLLKGLKINGQSVNNVSEGKGMLKKYLSGCQVFIVLDDVDHVDQVDALLPVDVLHPESLILITSRDKHVLANSRIQECSIYELTGLNEHHSRELFCSYAFFDGRPPSDFESLVDRFVKACHGLPLSLKVIGGLVYGNDHKSDWEAQLEKLQQTLPLDIQKCLRISYDALDGNEKNIFLDIACFFIGKNRDMAIRIWNGSGWTGSPGFRTLQNKCLVELDGENNIKMHDHLRDLGRSLANDPKLPRRLWRGIEDIDDLMHHSEGKSIVRGVRLSAEHYDDQDDYYFCNYNVAHVISYVIQNDEDEEEEDDEEEEEDWDLIRRKMIRRNFQKLLQLREVRVTKLQLLDVDILTEDILRGMESPDLIWLRWRNCHLSSLPPWIPLKNIRVLEVQGKQLISLWNSNSKGIPLELRELRIFAPLQTIPKSIGKLKHLEKLELHYVKFEEMPCAIGELRSLEELIIENSSLTSILGLAELTKLRNVVVIYCSDLEELAGFENLSSLEVFQVSGCPKLKSIRGSAELTKLRNVVVTYCSDLEELPGFENLRSLEVFQVSGCPKLKSIRGSAELTKLRNVVVRDCSDLEELPGFENLSSLEELEVDGCPKLKSIRGLAELTKLRNVFVTDCSDLEELPGFENLRSLEELKVYKCPKLKGIGGWAELTKLRNVVVTDFSDLEELPGFENLRSLEVFQVSGCPKLKSIRGLAELTKLRNVVVTDCSDLEELSGFENLRSLEVFQVSRCPKLKSIRGSAELTKLQGLNISACSDLLELPGFENLRSLEQLQIFNCPKLKSLGGSAELTKLRRIKVRGCSDLEELPGFENLSLLEEFDVSGCVKLKSIRASAEVTKLRRLNISDCSDLEELPGFENLRSLEEFKVYECPKLKGIPGSAELTKLRILNIRDCSSFQELPGSAEFTKLQGLNISDCSDLQELPGFENLRSLEQLKIFNCPKLKSLGGSAELTKLRRIEVRRCSDLEELPGFENLSSLEEFDVSSCVKLKSIRASAEVTKLRRLNISDFSDLEELLGFENLRSLEELKVYKCQKLKSIRGSAELTKLRNVHIHSCSDLEELPGFENLRSLEELEVCECPKLKSIRGSAELTKLRNVDVRSCSVLEELPGLENVRSLRILNVSGCVKLESIPGLAQLTGLRTLIVSGCSALEELPGLENMRSLWVLDVSGCVKLESIPGLAQLTELRTLIVSGCSALEELPAVEHLSLSFLTAEECPKLQWVGAAVEQLKQRGTYIRK